MKQTIEETVKRVLERLFMTYRSNYGVTTNVADIIVECGYDPSDIGKYLLDNGWVERPRFGRFGFEGVITLEGVSKLKPDYLDDIHSKIVSTLGGLGNPTQDLLEILDFKPEDYMRALGLAKYLEAKGFISLKANGREIFVTLTTGGLDYYERHKPFAF